MHTPTTVPACGQTPTPAPELIPPHCGYEDLKAFQLARLVYDITVGFCDRFVDRSSRTHDQMVQSARSGTQNIAEGSADSATSKKTELRLTNIAFGSLHELKLDYEDFLRHRYLPQLPPASPALKRFRARRVADMDAFQTWVRHEVDAATKAGRDVQVFEAMRARFRESVFASDHSSLFRYLDSPAAVSIAVLAANAALSLLNVTLPMLGALLRQQGEQFVEHGGFTERMYRTRSAARRV